MVIQWHLMGFDGIYDDIPSGIQKTHWKDPPCYQWVNPRTFDWAMASIAMLIITRG